MWSYLTFQQRAESVLRLRKLDVAGLSELAGSTGTTITRIQRFIVRRLLRYEEGAVQLLAQNGMPFGDGVASARVAVRLRRIDGKAVKAHLEHAKPKKTPSPRADRPLPGVPLTKTLSVGAPPNTGTSRPAISVREAVAQDRASGGTAAVLYRTSPWTQEEIADLNRLREAGSSLSEMVTTLQRSPQAVRTRLDIIAGANSTMTKAPIAIDQARDGLDVVGRLAGDPPPSRSALAIMKQSGAYERMKAEGKL